MRRGQITKAFPVFDCDAHINDPLPIWDYVPESKKELVRQTYWRDETQAWLNGDTPVFGGGGKTGSGFGSVYNPVCIAGPQINKRLMRKLNSMAPLSDTQSRYLHHDGALEGSARIKDMDLMGIDQVLVIPSMVLMYLPFAHSAEGVDAFCRAYNDFLVDWCADAPDRLFGAALLPVSDPVRTAKEIGRANQLGHRVGLIRPIDAQGKYPNDLRQAMRHGGDGGYDDVFRAFEDSGMVLGMHTFLPSFGMTHPLGDEFLFAPGDLFPRAGVDGQTFSFVHEMQSWLVQVLLSGFLDRYNRLKMAIYESNAEWLTAVLENTDRVFKLYANERPVKSDRLPSEAFYDQCVIGFESDETSVFRQWGEYENIGIWASDAYHIDGADAWSAIRNMTASGVPESVQAKLLGENARRFYGIEPKTYITEEPGPIDRPAWFPPGRELDEWADLVAHPRENEAKLKELGLDFETQTARRLERMQALGAVTGGASDQQGAY
jgi:predicted TIM-barrel fold metal-dependent hydrolase